MNFFPRLLSCSMYNALLSIQHFIISFIFCIVFVCLCGGGLFISYVNSCSFFFTDFPKKIFLPKKAPSASSEQEYTTQSRVYYVMKQSPIICLCSFFGIGISTPLLKLSGTTPNCTHMVFWSACRTSDQ